MTKKTRLINVELALKTNHDVLNFVGHFERQGHFVNVVKDKQYRHYVYLDPVTGVNANEIISLLCKIIHDMPTEVAAVWHNSDWRQFYIGYEVGDDPGFFTDHIDEKTICLCCEVGAGIGLALYARKV